MFGIFDSGVGGLSVFRLLERKFPGAGFIYLGDTINFPYGEKSKKAIRNYALKNTNFLISKGANNIIIACHTASAFAGKYLKAKEDKLGIKIYDVISPTIKKITNSNIKKLGVIGTNGTILSNIYSESLKKLNIEIISQPCPLLVALIEEGWINRPETKSILEYYLLPLKKKKIDALVLSCTHYSLLKKDIIEIMGDNIKVIDPAQILANKLKNSILNTQDIKHIRNFFVTDYPTKFLKLSKIFLGKNIKVKKTKLKDNYEKNIRIQK